MNQLIEHPERSPTSSTVLLTISVAPSRPLNDVTPVDSVNEELPATTARMASIALAAVVGVPVESTSAAKAESPTAMSTFRIAGRNASESCVTIRFTWSAPAVSAMTDLVVVVGGRGTSEGAADIVGNLGGRVPRIEEVEVSLSSGRRVRPTGHGVLKEEINALVRLSRFDVHYVRSSILGTIIVGSPRAPRL